MIGWIATWFIGTVLIAPAGYNPVNPAVSETGIWRMLYVSPLPFLLALGVKECLDLPKYVENVGISVRRLDSILILFSVALLSGILVFSSNLLVRLAVVLTTLTLITFLSIRRKQSQLRVLLASLLLMILVNAAFRSLYPLLLDPRNLLG